MKFSNILKIGAVAVSLLLTVNAFALGCRTNSCKTKCATKCEKPCGPRKCVLPDVPCETITRTVECQGKPKYKWVCHQEKLPCSNENKVYQYEVKPECVGVEIEGAPVRMNKARR